MNITIIEHKEEGYIVNQRIQDGYINATALCKATGKLWGHYYENKTTKEFLNELSRSIGIPIDLLVEQVTTGANESRGTYIHPQVAINLGQWLSPKFAVKVSKWISDWMNNKTSTNKTVVSMIDLSNPADVIRGLNDLTALWLKKEEENKELIRTKAWIGNKREATAMATAANLSKKVNKLEDELGKGKNFKAVAM